MIPLDSEDDELLVTPCCETRIEPGAGFRSVFCCSEEYTWDELKNHGE